MGKNRKIQAKQDHSGARLSEAIQRGFLEAAGIFKLNLGKKEFRTRPARFCIGRKSDILTMHEELNSNSWNGQNAGRDEIWFSEEEI